VTNSILFNIETRKLFIIVFIGLFSRKWRWTCMFSFCSHYFVNF